MKKALLFITAGFIAITASAQDQKVKESQVAPAAKATFSRLFPGAAVEQWKHEGNNWEAEFNNNSVETSVLFGPNGQHLETEAAISMDALPKAATDHLNRLGEKKAAKAYKITDAAGKISYKARVDATDYAYDEKGVLKK